MIHNLFKNLFKNRTFYLVNFILLILHEIDSAYWKEWEMYRFPGSIDLYLILNVVLVILAFLGFYFILQHNRRGLHFAIGMAGYGLFVVFSHVYFLLIGMQQFNTILSILGIAVTLLVSIGQGYLAIRTIVYARKHRHSRRSGEHSSHEGDDTELNPT